MGFSPTGITTILRNVGFPSEEIVERDSGEEESYFLISGMDFMALTSAVWKDPLYRCHASLSPGSFTLLEKEYVGEWPCQIQYEFSQAALGVEVGVFIKNVSYFNRLGENLTFPTLALTRAYAEVESQEQGD